MLEYKLVEEHISLLKRVRRSLYEVDLEGSNVAEIVLVSQAIDSLNQSIVCLVDLRKETK